MAATNPTPEHSDPMTVSPIPRGPLGRAVCHELAHMQDNWWWFLALGMGWIVLGRSPCHARRSRPS